MILVAIMLMSGFVFVMIQNKFINDDQQTEREKEKQRDIMREELIHQANSLMKSYYYHEAIDLLKSVPEIYNDKLKAEVDKIEDFISKLRPYEGRIEHIFMHSLIVYPELAFNANSSQPQGYNYWMITQREFEIILPLLLEKGYVLVRISDLYHVDELGNVFKKELYLPQGKRPLLMSIDNVGYPTSRANEGFATRLVIDNNNEVSAVIRTIEGNEIESRTAEVFPIVDDFVKAHPEFSYKGAKGILGITGSWGGNGV